MLGQRLLYVMLSLSLLTISCKGSNNSSSDNKKKVEEPRPPISQPLPEIPHDQDPIDDDSRDPDFSDAEKVYVKVSRKFCLKVIHGKYIPSVLCHDFDPNESYKAYRWCDSKPAYASAKNDYSVHNDHQDSYAEEGYSNSCSNGFPYFVQYHYGIRKIYFASLSNYSSFTNYRP